MALEDYITEFSASSIDIWSIIVAILLSAALALVLAEVYKKFGQSLSNRAKFSILFAPIAMTTALIISIVKSSLALSLGLVGALSIIRFRTAIKEPEELGYLFLAISVGLGMGASLYLLTIISFVLIAAIIVFINFRKSKNELGLNFVIKTVDLEIGDVLSVLQKNIRHYVLRRASEEIDGNEYAFFVDNLDVQTLNKLSSKLKKLDKNIKISYYEAQVGI